MNHKLLLEEKDARRALAAAQLELAQDVQYGPTLEKAATACEKLCQIANAPNFYWGLELINVLDHYSKYSSKRISSLIAVFLEKIQVVIDDDKSRR